MRAPGLFFFVLLLPAVDAPAQAPELGQLEERLRRFDYQGVIEHAGILLGAPADRFSVAEKVEILRMKAISHYSLLEMNASLGCFLEIVKLDPHYELDPVKTSPKIINFFQEIRARFPEPVERVRTEVRIDTVRIAVDTITPLRSALWRSALIPGWGHHNLGRRAKGRWLGALSGLTLAATLYSVIDSEKCEADYLRQTDPQGIAEHYSRYNRAYNRRNIMILSYALIWLYAQTDLLLSLRSEGATALRFSLSPDTALTFQCTIGF